jgi:hypothetical protein
MVLRLFQEDLGIGQQAPSRMQVGHSIGYFGLKPMEFSKSKLMMHHLN